MSSKRSIRLGPGGRGAAVPRRPCALAWRRPRGRALSFDGASSLVRFLAQEAKGVTSFIPDEQSWRAGARTALPLPPCVLICRGANGAGAWSREGAARRQGTERTRRSTPCVDGANGQTAGHRRSVPRSLAPPVLLERCRSAGRRQARGVQCCVKPASRVPISDAMSLMMAAVR